MSILCFNEINAFVFNEKCILSVIMSCQLTQRCDWCKQEMFILCAATRVTLFVYYSFVRRHRAFAVSGPSVRAIDEKHMIRTMTVHFKYFSELASVFESVKH